MPKTVWGVKEDHTRGEYTIASESFATQAEADAFCSGLVAALSGQFCEGMHFPTQEDAARKAQDMNTHKLE